ncbi:hypothetical protein RBG61_09695 [Paludicola sp. MB14-C6]|uniref:hypothetical protein n=1 Tax=Paludihabitans sp. MB14-C6 TaxID=3070656 RepID=UPI0027DBADA1|nr:hypothetical protein [Paludicola sp. MB14-C6]WMJ22260.1 hypothetical protein RBG61_09695 [Paludicola sp. MB14-C6]
MDDKNISVEEILQELQLKKAKNEKSKPQSDLNHVNEIIEQIITEKKNEQIKKENITLSDEEKRSLEKEIKAQTRSISQLYEQMEKDNTRQLKKQQREERAVEKLLRIEPTEKKETELLKNQDTQSLKVTSVQSNQKVKVETSSFQKLNSEEKQDKLEELKQTANNDHIKREMQNITSHFGRFKMDDKHVEDSYGKLEMNEKNYKEYKKNRTKKIEKFVLQEETPEKSLNKEDVIAPKPITTQLQTEEKVKPIPILEEKDAVLQNNPIEEEIESQDEVMETVIHKGKQPLPPILNESDEDEELEYTNASQNEEITQYLSKLTKTLFFRVSSFSVLSLIALVLCFFQVSGTQFTAFHMITISPSIYVMANIILLAIAMCLAFDVLISAIQSMLNREPVTDMLYSVTTVVCLAANMLLLFNTSEALTKGVQLFTPILIITFLFLYISKYMEVKMITHNFDFIKNVDNEERYGITMVDDFAAKVDMTKGVIDEEPFLAKTVKTKFFSHFLFHVNQPDASDKANSKIVLYALITSIISGGLAFLLSNKNIYVAMTMASGVMVIATSFVATFFSVFPIYDTKAVLSHFKAMIPNQDAFDEYSEVNSILLDAYDLFPKDTVILHGIKTFSGKRIDEAIVNAASVLCESRSILANVFLTIIADNKSLLKPVDSIKYEDLMGISAWVDNRRVIIGNRELMIQHSIAVPSKNYELKYQEQSQEIVYVATEGELSAAFIIELKAEQEIVNMLQVLERNGIAAIVKSVDSCLTPTVISQLFDIGQDFIKILPSRLHNTYYKQVESKEKMDAVLGTNGTIESYIISTVTTKKLSHCMKTGLLFHIICIVLGVLGFFALFLTGHLNLCTNLAVLLYLSAFFLIYLFNQKSIRL